ncbi:hypothetical protein F4820DRAFT_134049 [Hypoxylon rubiginosum]|uniref:Uncharacterized protein n=1 Tax=Hypoxylon rubiginosum TaxID=110542 RepID=A0ACB9ZAQ9_9PEZI|nr:hypothetical protein F4820DRAFT_134049 [Hypoxylon rubiginosum]
MKYSTVFAGWALGSWLGVATAMDTNQSPGLPVVASATSPVLQKRDAFSCYGSTNTSLSDCQGIIDTIRADAQQNFTLFANVCAVWDKGTCKVRLCAQPYISRPVNRTATWLATYIASPLLDGCIGKGQEGVLADHPNINSHSGTYRLWVS